MQVHTPFYSSAPLGFSSGLVLFSGKDLRWQRREGDYLEKFNEGRLIHKGDIIFQIRISFRETFFRDKANM